ncbi:sensor histidine kinase [Paenibacillus psychroresistens]|uniref:histidine kinase n=1 Tax=Paenibacillus psychroresistens TaxID=1778678 RepID=A0A6B8RQT5_9BACL|nr:sensor histidine kinase [Paenibacillus psychroresistens]QGQ98164.1 sensor histidine kinase [Paenibacillus psychroresistens]
MKKKLSKLSPTLNRIVMLSVMLTLVAQIVLVYIGISYASSIDNSMNKKRAAEVLNQFQQSLLYQLNDVNNLLLLLQTPEFSDFFKDLMNLREDEIVNQEKQKLLRKLDTLNLSTEIISSIYFIGKDVNQKSFRKVTESSQFEELTDIQMDVLGYSKLDSLFIADHDQFTYYQEDDFTKLYRTDYPLLNKANLDQLNSFISNLKNHLILTNGNENGVFIVIVLKDNFFQQAMPHSKNDSESLFSVVNAQNNILWSNIKDEAILQDIGKESSSTAASNLLYTNTVKELSPFQLRAIHTEVQNSSYLVRYTLLFKMVGLSLLTLLVTLFISLFYLRKVFKPFRIISKKLKNQSITNEMVLRSLPENLIKKGFHSISMRNKLILVLLTAVSIPAISDGILYSRFLTQDVQKEMKNSMETIGQYTVASIQNGVRSMENILNGISVSKQFQNYITDMNSYQPGSNAPKAINLSIFPGLNDVSYFVLLDERGICIYSSIFSNNKDIFNTNPGYLQNREDSYWVSNYKDIFNHTSAALVKRIEPNSDTNVVTYLLLVPKQSIFQNVESGLINASYYISDTTGKIIYQSRVLTESNPAKQYRFTQVIPNTNWRISISYINNEIIEKNRVYQEQFLLIMFIVFLLSMAAAFIIAEILVKPVKQLKDTMLAVGAGDFAQRVAYNEDNEIGGIIKSYNGMIEQLDQTIRQNMSIMEENANNKMRENDLISMKTRAELQMLQAQINPHFLYNTLEAINMRSMKSGNHEISTLVSALADLFRYSISKGSNVVELDKELMHAINYITIQQIRFGNSFLAEINVPQELRGIPTLKFIIQPIIENSIKHGFVGWESGGIIRISAAIQGDRIQILLSDNGIGMNDETLQRLRAEMERELGDLSGEDSGIGLKNVYHRLKLFYKDQMSMVVSSQLMKGTVIKLEFPLAIEKESF